MPVINCHMKDCSFATTDVADAAGAVMLSHHLANEHTDIATSTVQAPKIDPPMIALRWHDFEANTRVARKELRDEKDFCDVTLVCDGKQVSAHKVILAGGSTFFQQVLKQNPHPHPLIYLKGVRYDYLSSILDFVYTGEANINEREVESFLEVADDLQIIGLIEKNPSRKTSAKEGETIASNDALIDQCSDVKKETVPLLHSVTPSRGNNRGSQSFCDEGHTDAPLAGNMKVELDHTIHSTASFGMEPNPATVTIDLCEQSEEELYEETDDNKNKVRDPVDSVYKSENDENTHYGYVEGENYEGVDMEYDGEGGENHTDQQFSTMISERKVCSECGKSVRDNYALKVHMRNHTGEKPYPCLFCDKTFASSDRLKRHTMIHSTADQE